MALRDFESSPARFRSKFCQLTPPDQDILSALVREKYPNAIFTSIDTKSREVIYYSSISECEKDCDIWIPEPGWKPRFGIWPEGTTWAGYTRLKNIPEMSILYRQCRLQTSKVSHFTDRDLPERPLNAELTRLTKGGETEGYFYDDEPENKAFLSWFFNLTGRLWTNRYQVIDLCKNEAIDEISGVNIWTGPDTIRRCAEEPNFFYNVWDPIVADYNTLVGLKALPKKPRGRKAR